MISIRTVFLALFVALIATSTLAQTPLEAGFADPPKEARPSVYYLLLNGYMNPEHMKWELEQLHAAGITGLCVFDMGARGAADALPPDGPAFASKEWIANFGRLLEKAGDLGMEVELAACSSWDLGGAWVAPEDASKALYRTTTEVRGPARFDAVLPYPDLPAAAPRDADGNPIVRTDIAVLAVPVNERTPAHEFVFKLPDGDGTPVHRAVLYNTESGDAARYGEMHLFAKDFSVAVSTTDASEAAFEEVMRGSLEPRTGAQTFDFEPTDAQYVRLRIFNGHNPDFDSVQLGEFELYTTGGLNVAASHQAARMRQTALLHRFSDEAGHSGNWTAENIHDGAHSGAGGSWASAGRPPVIVENRDDVAVLTEQLGADGRLVWGVPPGDWHIIRYVCANTGERLKVPSPVSDGLATDHFSGPVTERFIDHLTGALEAELGPLGDTALELLYLPSYEVRGTVWTEDFLDQFEAYRGYDPTRFLPALTGTVLDSQDVTDRFLYDYRKTLGDLLVDAYYRVASTSAHKVGLGVEAEAGGPGPPIHQVPVDALKALGAIDEMRGEWWPWREEQSRLWVVKETACAAHIYGRKRVHMESFTGFRHWEDGPVDLKPSADRAFCEGMNHVVWHTSSHSPPEAGKPGWVYGAGTHCNPNLVWWPMAGAFVDYLSRCSYLLQQGHFVADVCYYYGDQGFNFVPPKHVDPSLGPGFDYDVTNPEGILERMSARDGRIVLPDGMHYELLVLPDREDIDLDVLRKVRELVRAGATVVGRKPARSNGLHEYETRDAEVRRIADELWGDCDGESVTEHTYGEGKIVWGRTLRETLAAKGVGPDFTVLSEDVDIDFIHRTTDAAEIYFVSNRRDARAAFDAVFRVQDRVPEFWDPATGTTRRASTYSEVDGGVRCTLDLAPAGSVFVVFRKDTDAVPPPASRMEALPPIPLDVDWEVRFPYGDTAETAKFDQLVSWTQHPSPAIKYFSGIAVYETTFEISDAVANSERVELNLGDLWCIGRVIVNGEDLGIVWKPPYSVDITSAVESGSNSLRVEIANTWANRLAGDAQLPEAERTTNTNITATRTTDRKQWKELPLRDAGLFGPVRVVPYSMK